MQHKIYSLCLALVGLMASLTACSDQDYPGQGGVEGDGNSKFQLCMNLTVPALPDSRATYEQGVGDYENAINLTGKDYKVLLFTNEDDIENSTLLFELDPNTFTLTPSTPNLSNPTYRIYTLRAEVGEDVAQYKKLKVVILANWGDYPTLTPGSTTIDDLAGYSVDAGISSEAGTTYDADGKLVASTGKFIPMFGVKNCASLSWVDQMLTWAGDLWLLRAVAKIEVRAAEGGAEIESVELSRYNKLGTCAPMRVYREEDYVMGEDQYKAFDYLTLPGGKNVPAEASYAVQPDADGLFTVYVPEYQILADPEAPKGYKVSDYARLYVKFKGNTKVYPVDFKYYTAAAAADNDAAVGDFFDIKRNFYYRYSLHMLEGEPEIRVDVLPYRAVELKPDFGLLLKDLTLNRYVVHLFTDDGVQPSVSETVIAYDETMKKIPASEIEWTLDRDVANHVCTIEENADGECVIKPIMGKRGRDVLTASKKINGLTVTAECVIEVSDRHLGLDKTFLGLTPKDNGVETSTGSFIADIISETDDHATLSWELLNEDDLTPSDLDIEVLVYVNGKQIENGGVIGGNDAEVRVNSGTKVGTAHLWLYYDGPGPNNQGPRVRYSTYCEIMVQNVSLSCSPKALSVIVDQTTAFNTSVLPKFSNFIPSVKYVSENPEIATVDANGLIRGITPGTVKITAYNDTDFPMRISDDVTVTVKPNDLVLMRHDGVTVADYVELMNGESVLIKALSHGKDVSKSVKWSIEGDKFIENVKNGLLKGNTGKDKDGKDIDRGTSTVVATYTTDGGVSCTARCVVVVSKGRSLIIDSHPHAISPNAEVPMKAHIFPDSIPWDQRTYKVNWTSNPTSVIAFENRDGMDIAVAKNPGAATLTAKAKYGTQNLEATTEVEVLGAAFGEEVRKGVFVYDANGNNVGEMTSLDGEYTHEQIVDEKNGIMSRITIPMGQTWAVKVGSGPSGVEIKSVKWEKYIRYNYHEDRIRLKVSQNTKQCMITNIAQDVIGTRYNEVIVTITYVNGQTEVRRFAVFSTN